MSQQQSTRRQRIFRPLGVNRAPESWESLPLPVYRKPEHPSSVEWLHGLGLPNGSDLNDDRVDVAIAVLRALRNYPDAPEEYIDRVRENCVRNIQRARYREENRNRRRRPLPEPDQVSDGQRQVHAVEDRDELEHLWNQIADNQIKQLLALLAEDYTISEAAQVCGISPSTAKRRLQDLRASL